MHILFIINITNTAITNASVYAHNDLLSAVISLDLRFLDEENSGSMVQVISPQK